MGHGSCTRRGPGQHHQREGPGAFSAGDRAGLGPRGQRAFSDPRAGPAPSRTFPKPTAGVRGGGERAGREAELLHTCVHKEKYTCRHTRALTQTYMQTLRHLYSNIHTDTHRYIHRHSQTHSHTDACTHTLEVTVHSPLQTTPPQSPCHPLPPAGSPAPKGTALCKLGRNERPGWGGGLDTRGATLSHLDCPWVWGPLKEPRGPLMSTQSTAGPRALMGPRGTGSGVMGQV